MPCDAEVIDPLKNFLPSARSPRDKCKWRVLEHKCSTVRFLPRFSQWLESRIGPSPMQLDVVSQRAIKPRYWEIIQEELVDVPSGKATSVEDIWEAIEKIERYVAGLDRDTFHKRR